jgi:phytoene/squalene synthetase
MSNPVLYPQDLIAEPAELDPSPEEITGQQVNEGDSSLPALITKATSEQTYSTIRYLVDRDRTLNAYRAYAYFRWVDDLLDEQLSTRSERMAFVERQQTLMECCYRCEWLGNLSDEENMLAELIRSDLEPCSGLQVYLLNMMGVMVFDAERRGRLISQEELAQYSANLSTAVTEALHYFIGHDDHSPNIPTRYLAVMGAHITHMLRDAFEDLAAGYFNIPYEFMDTYQLDPCDVESDAYREWAKHRVHLAQTCFKAGKAYLAQVTNSRCQKAGYAYISQFENVLTTIENEGYRLRPQYPDG